MTFKVICRKEIIYKNSTSPLCLLFFQGKRKKAVGLGVSVALKHWDAEAQKVTDDCPDRDNIQFQITAKVKEYEKKIQRLEIMDIPVTFENLFEQNSKRLNCSVGEYLKQTIERLETLGKYGSASKHRSLLSRLSECSDRTYTCKLNSYGYVTEVTEDNDEKDGAIYYTLEYDKNGYLQRIEQRYSYNESRKRVSECTWRDGNLIESKLTDYYEDGTDITTVKYSYSKTTTPINIDLFYIDGGYIDVLEPLDLLGFYGRQSAKLPNKADITYSGESESESDDFGVYTLNGDGTVARIDCGSVSYELIY